MGNANAAKQAAYAAAIIAFFAFVYCGVFFVTASFTATHTGLIKWGAGWQALMELLHFG